MDECRTGFKRIEAVAGSLIFQVHAFLNLVRYPCLSGLDQSSGGTVSAPLAFDPRFTFRRIMPRLAPPVPKAAMK